MIATSKSFGGDYVQTQGGTPGVDPLYESWLHAIMPSSFGSLPRNGAIFEDTDTYIAIHTTIDSEPFRSKYIYLWGSWTNPAVSKDPEYLQPMYEGSGPGDENWLGHYIIKTKEHTEQTDGSGDTLTIPPSATAKVLVWEIYSEEGLSWFSSYVNGLNVFTTGDTYTSGGNDTIHRKYNKNINPYAEAKLMNDLDMSRYFWVPIGSVTKFNDSGTGAFNPSDPSSTIYTDNHDHQFKGEFDGQGHIIKGIDCRYLTGVNKFGLFGELAEKAVVKNVFVDESLFFTDKIREGYRIGGIAGSMTGGATLSGAEARSHIDVNRSLQSATYVGGLVGKMEGTNNAPAIIHSSMAMPEIKGEADYVGGLVGYVSATDSLLNSFSNPKFLNAPAAGKYIGGLVGVNYGLVENCYSRLQSGSNETGLGWLAGTNNGTINFSYAPKDKIDAGGAYKKDGNNDPVGSGTYSPTVLYSGKYGFKHRDHNIVAENSYVKNDTLIGGLQRALNAWVKAKKTAKRPYESWSRTMGTTINDDLPVLMLSDFNAVGTADSIYLHYKHNVDSLIRPYTALNPNIHPTPSIYLYDTTMNGSTPVYITKSNIGSSLTNQNVMLAINENVGILQNVDLRARVCVTFDNSNGNPAPALGGEPYDWHMFSPALRAVPMGLQYYDDMTGYSIQSDYESLKENGIPDDNDYYHNRAFMDPPRATWYQSDNASGLSYDAGRENIGYFPTNAPYGKSEYSGSAVCGLESSGGSYDFYGYSEKYRHWINFKRKGVDGFFDHWHQDAFEKTPNNWTHPNIPYKNETQFQVCKGYMLGVSEASMLMADGILNNGNNAGDPNGNLTITATNMKYIYETPYSLTLRGTNLIGNPYQSYLDFSKLAEANPDIYGSAYYIFDADKERYICYPDNSTPNPVNAPQYIHPHQGFLVMVPDDADADSTGVVLTFKNSMRLVAGNSESTFRSDKLYYPLVNLFCYSAEGKYDVTTVEVNRPDEGGGLKMKGMQGGKMRVYARQDNRDYQTVFTPIGTRTVPVRFEAFEDGVFTMKWQTLYGDFNYLHLIDNLTGADVDCLTAQEYRFEASTSDYLSRFKLVFEATGLEEEDDNEDDNGSSTVNFAFRMGDELIVNGEGYFELFDVQGRRLTAKQLAGAQSSVSLPNVAAGVYLLRLTGDKQVKTQKMVISY